MKAVIQQPGQGLPGLGTSIKFTGADSAQKTSQEKAFPAVAKCLAAIQDSMNKIDPSSLSISRQLDLASIKGPVAADTAIPSAFARKGGR